MFLIKESEVLRWEIAQLKEDLKRLEEKEEKSNKDKQGLYWSSWGKLFKAHRLMDNQPLVYENWRRGGRDFCRRYTAFATLTISKICSIVQIIFIWWLDEMQAQFDIEKNQLLAEIEAERSHHQRILKDYNRLQQRYENLQDEVEILQSPVVSPKKDQITGELLTSRGYVYIILDSFT